VSDGVMKILLLSQVFYPDVVSVAQYLADLGVSLSEKDHEVTVLCSSHGYDNSSTKLPRKETWKGITIRRVPVWTLGKKSKIRRIVSASSFFVSSSASLMLMDKQDVVVVVPPPPLLSVLAALFVRIRGGRLLFWNMDINPDEAIAAGWMKPDSLAARILGAALRYSLRASSNIVVLDHFMKDRIVAKGIPEGKVRIIPVWTHDQAAYYEPEGRAAFRMQLGVDKKFVVMYSGNHSPLHPLDTVLQAALRLRENAAIAFAFVGGGSEFARVKDFAQEHSLSNVICVPYQPLDHLAGSLSAADLQVVLLGDPFVGIVHPCKIYNMLAVGAPFLYVGPAESHITDLQQYPEIAQMGRFVRHGDVDQVVDVITQLASDFASGASSRPGRPADLDRFSQRSLMPMMIELVEATVHSQ
jgi:glycosyltransferase involved in cell wall biosynthesis